MNRKLAVLILCLAGAARAESARVATLVRALDDAKMPRTAMVMLAALATDASQPDEVRVAAGEELVRRAPGDASVAQILLAQGGDPAKPPPALALQLARGHLERALQIAPPEEGAAFEGQASPGSLQPASAEAPRAIPSEAQQEIDRARALVGSIPADAPQAAQAHQIAGLAALAAGDQKAAANEFLAIATAPARGDEATQRRDQALLQLARLAYQGDDDRSAIALYQRVGRAGPEWLDALFEASWAHFRQSEDEKALGNLLTLQAPFFQDRFFPESLVLKALVMYQNCRYADARTALAEFEQKWRPVHDGLAALLEKVHTPESATELLAHPGPGSDEVKRIEGEPDVRGALTTANELAQEIDSVDKRPQPFKDSALIARAVPLARKARMALLETAGRKLLSRAAMERAELRELLGQSLRLSYEIAGREKELAMGQGASAESTKRDPSKVDDDEEFWPFQGEYWRDELGSYQYQLGRRCKKPRLPPQTAKAPSQEPPAVAADPKE